MKLKKRHGFIDCETCGINGSVCADKLCFVCLQRMVMPAQMRSPLSSAKPLTAGETHTQTTLYKKEVDSNMPKFIFAKCTRSLIASLFAVYK